MSDKNAVVSRRVLRSVSMTDVKEHTSSNTNLKDDNLQNRIEELEKFILSLNLDSALIEPLQIKPKVGSKRGRKKIEEKVTLTEDEQELIDPVAVKPSKKGTKSSSRKGVAFKSSIAIAASSTNNENNDALINQKADSSTEEIISSGGTKISPVAGVTKKSRSVRSKSPATISPLVSRNSLSANISDKKEDSAAATSMVPFASSESVETLNSVLDQPTDKQMRKMPNFLAARLNAKGPTAPSASVIAARKAAAAAAATASAPTSSSSSRIPSAPRQGRDLSTGRSKTESAASVTFSASTKRPAPSVTSYRSSSAERKSIGGGVLKSATKRSLSVPSKALFDWKAAASSMAAVSSATRKESVATEGDEMSTSESTHEDEVVVEATPAVCLFIAHDNPQLSKTVMSRLMVPGTQSTPPAPAASPKEPVSVRGMQIMLESKGQGDQTHFLVGDIIYSGDYAHVQDTATSNVRGSEWLIVTNLRAVKHAVKQFKTRDSNTNKEVIEINLVDVPADSVADVSTAAGVVEFLSACQARVDCILDPYHSDNAWYPYFEGTAGGGAQRKMAPQFRSQGIGYIRLGDDMSNFGVAFVSLDAGATYLDNGATSIVDSSLVAKTKFVATPNSKAIRGKTLLSRKSLSTDAEDFLAMGTGAATPSAALAGNRKSMGGVKRAATGTSKQSSMEKVADVLSSLQDATIKFSQRTEFLNSLQALLNDIYLKTSRADILEAFVLKNLDGLAEVLRVLLEYLTKQKHPLVVAATLQCIGTLTYGDLLATHFAVSWRALVVETAHMLRNNNKQIFEAVVGALGGLYRARALSFAYLSGGGGGVLLDILNGPRSSGGSSSSSAALVVNGGSNVVKVVTWLDSVAKGDLEAAVRLCAVQSTAASTDEALQLQRQVECASCQSNLVEALRRVSFLLSHREEVTREHGIALVVSYVVLFVLFGHFSQEGLAQLAGQVLDAKAIGADSPEMLVVLEALEKASARSYEKVLAGVALAVSRVAGELSVMLAEAPVVVAANVSASEVVTSTVDESDVQSGLEGEDSGGSKEQLLSAEKKEEIEGEESEEQQQMPITPMVDTDSSSIPVILQSPEQGDVDVAPLKIEF